MLGFPGGEETPGRGLPTEGGPGLGGASLVGEERMSGLKVPGRLDARPKKGKIQVLRPDEIKGICVCAPTWTLDRAAPRPCTLVSLVRSPQGPLTVRTGRVRSAFGGREQSQSRPQPEVRGVPRRAEGPPPRPADLPTHLCAFDKHLQADCPLNPFS